MLNDPKLKRLLTLAQRYASQRRTEAALKVCEQIAAVDPREPWSMAFRARAALAAGDAATGIELLQARAADHPTDPAPARELAQALASAGRLAEAARARVAALTLAPDAAEDWAELGRLHRDLGHEERAARCFTRAFIEDPELAAARRNPRAPMPRRHLSQDGDDLLLAFHYASNDALARSLAEDRDAELPDRWGRFLRRFHQREAVRFADQRQQPDFHYYEGLTARPFWPRELFPWLDEVEAATDVIRQEFLAAQREQATFLPYVTAVEGAPEAWKAMSGRLDWASLHLFRGNKPVAENCGRCPVTAELMGRLPLARADGHAPEVFFSVLEPGTHIPPHYGVSNTKLAIHLPLIIPPDCAIRVGGETEGWAEGRCLIFDDSFLHEAWNRSDELRVVLIFETWNPDLLDLERAALRAIIDRGESWYRTTRALSPADVLP